MKTSFTYLIPLLGIAFALPYRASAQPGSGIKLGETTVLIPQVRVSYNYDDNVNLRKRAKSEESPTLDDNTSDSYSSYLASLNLTRFAGNRQLRGNAWYGQDFYDSFTELDSEKYGASGEFFWASPGGKTSLDLNLLYEYAVDRAGSTEDGLQGTGNVLPDFETVSERVVRDIYAFNATLNHELTTDMGTALSFGYHESDYEDEIFNDRTSTNYAVELNYRLTDKTQPYVQLGIGYDEDDGFVDEAEKPYFLVGARYKMTEKTSVNLAVGYEEYTRTPFERSFSRGADGQLIQEKTPGEEIEDSGFKYSASIHYRATSKSTLILHARNGYDSVASGNANSRRENSVSLTAAHQTTPRINQSLTANWRNDDYLSPVTVGEEEIDEEKETLRYQYRVNYETVRPWLSFFGNVSFEDGSSQIPGEDYTQTVLSLGATLRY